MAKKNIQMWEVNNKRLEMIIVPNKRRGLQENNYNLQLERIPIHYLSVTWLCWKKDTCYRSKEPSSYSSKNKRDLESIKEDKDQQQPLNVKSDE